MDKWNNHISRRIRALADCVDPSIHVLADIGADHGYLSILAVQSGKVERAIACDVKPGPLQKASSNIRGQGLEGWIEARLGSGLSVLSPGEADCAVLAGMGGLLMTELLSASPEVVTGLKQLILQPQRDLPLVRRFVMESTPFVICGERFVSEAGQGYFLLDCRPSLAKKTYDDRDYYLGKFLRHTGGEEYQRYINRQINVTRSILARRRAGSDAALQTAQILAWLEEEYAASVMGYAKDGGAGPAGPGGSAGQCGPAGGEPPS